MGKTKTGTNGSDKSRNYRLAWRGLLINAAIEKAKCRAYVKSK
ncbi:hypothetical protein [Parasphingorhabdus sp.]